MTDARSSKTTRAGLLMLVVLLAAATCGSALAGRSQRFGEYVVYYNAFDAGSRFTPYVAPSIELNDDPGAGIVIVAVRRPKDESVESVRADVAGRVTNLLGQNEPLTFSEVEDDGYVSYLADYDLERFRTADFSLDITPHGADESFDLEFEARIPERAD